MNNKITDYSHMYFEGEKNLMDFKRLEARFIIWHLTFTEIIKPLVPR